MILGATKENGNGQDDHLLESSPRCGGIPSSVEYRSARSFRR